MPPSLHELREFVVPIVSSRLRGIPAPDREDVCQEAWIDCWQQLACGHVNDWRAYSAQIARRRASDFLRRKKIRDQHFQRIRPWDLERPTECKEGPGPELERVIWLILEYFDNHRAPCKQIAIERYFQRLGWDAIGQRMSSTMDAVKKQWERCRKLLLENLGDEILRILDNALETPGRPE